MILGALVDYYEILAKAGDVPRQGYCMANVSYKMNLSQDGTLLGAVPLRQKVRRGKKTVEVPQPMEVPAQAKRAVNIQANFLCDNSSYVLGVDQKGKPERALKCFDAFKTLHHAVLDGVDDPCAQAILCFLDSWQPENAGDCGIIADDFEALTAGGNIVFSVVGVDYTHEIDTLQQAWDTYRASKEKGHVMQCLVTGKPAPIARLHPSIKGAGGQPTGVSIVSFNDRAYESYGREKQQGLNAPVSEYAAFAYTTVLNHLLADQKHKQLVSDTRVVYWAQSPKRVYQDLFAFSLNPIPSYNGERQIDSVTEKLLHDLFDKIAQGKPAADPGGLIDPDTRFFILGLAPNAARLSVRFFLQDDFSHIMENMKAHYDALDIQHAPGDYEFLPLWRLMQETVSPKSNDKAASPLLLGAVLRSIFAGQPYPTALFQSVMRRIRAEHDVNRGKAAIIKAHLIRNHGEKYKEVLTVALNEESTDKAYVLGRLFAVLEKAQLDANPGIKATIKDRYFTSACATPGSVFSILLRLSNHHTAKSEYGYISERRKQELMDKLEVQDDPYPAHLSLPEQGVFILGYYHQTKANYQKKNKEEK